MSGDTYPRYKFKAEELVKAARTTSYNIEFIRDWLQTMPVLPEMSDEQIAIFLIACKNDIEATKHCIICYFKHKANGPEIFANRDIDSDELTFSYSNVSKVGIMPKRTKENYTVAIGALKDTNYSNFILQSQVKGFYMYLDYILYDNPPDGLVVCIDIKGVGLMHITRLKLGIVKKFFQFLQEALPTQLRQIHILNTSYIFDKIIAILRPFMNKELFDMIITHPPNMDTTEFFEKWVPADLMPSDYGGNLPNLDQLSDETRNQVAKLRDYFKAGERQIEVYQDNRS